MIPAARLPWQSDDWRQILKSAIRDGDELLRQLDIVRTDVLAPVEFGVLVPHTYLRRMERGNPADPLLRQVLATREEQINPAHFVDDPLSERAQSPLPGLLHKYTGRALLTLTGACPIHCRYCFRRHFHYPGALDEVWRRALDYVRADESITEVILSGGDPLTLTDEHLQRLLEDIG
ncbi:MAG: 4Fe-4S cluster-binding domain-containing protein, partial [Pseudomonadales bacterium]